MVKRNTKNILIMLGLLLQFSFAMLAGALIGYFVDEAKGTMPFFTVVGICIASAVSAIIFVKIMRMAKRNMEKDERSDT